jgi:hypothetical protein
LTGIAEPKYSTVSLSSTPGLARPARMAAKSCFITSTDFCILC